MDDGFDQVLFHAILNMIFALGCQRHQVLPEPQRGYHAAEFCKRSQQLVSVEAIDVSNLDVVRLLLLRGLYHLEPDASSVFI